MNLSGGSEGPRTPDDARAALRNSEPIEFLRTLFAGCQCQYPVEFRPIPPETQSLFTRRPANVRQLSAQCARRKINLYFGIATREGGGTKSHCREIPALWTDIDFKHQPEREAKERLIRFSLQPSAIVESGAGLHAYWFLRNPVNAQVEGVRVEALLRGLSDQLGGDRGACDFSRVMRLPGTLNFKYTPPRECRVRELYVERRYDFVELERLFPSRSKHTLGDTKTITEVEGVVPQGKRNSTLARLAGKKFGEGWSSQDVRFWAQGWNRQQCSPPLPEREVLATVESIRKTQERNHPSSGTSYSDFSDLPSVWDQKAELEWVVDDLIASGSVTLIAAESGTGKTWLALAIAGAVAHGQAFAGRSARQLKVLYLDNENPVFTVKERLSEVGIEQTQDLKVWGGWLDAPVPGPQDPFAVRFAREQRGLIVVDPLVAFHTGSEQDATDTRAFMQYLRTLANLGATVLLLHHSGKAKTAKLYRGSSDIKASVDTAYHLQAIPENTDRLDELFLQCFKSRLAPGQSFGVRFERGVGFLPSDRSSSSLTRSGVEIIEEILTDRPGSNQGEVVELARQKGLSKHQAETALKNGAWRTESGRGREIRYYAEEEEFESLQI